MERVAVRAESIQDWNSLDDWIDGNVRDEYEGPLWAVLVQHTGGEARTVVLNQKMNQGKPDGFAALGMLAKRYNPKTPSRILHALTQVLSPPTVKDVRQAPRMVEEWEAAKGKLKVEFSEELSEVVQIAILTGMLPSDLQDKVFEMGNAGDLKYHKVRDAIVGIMNNRARVLEPTPMVIGQVGGRERERESRGQLRLGWRRRTVHFRCGCSWEGHVRRLSSLRGIWPFRQRVPNTREQRQVEGSEGW